MQSYSERNFTIHKENQLYEFIAYTTIGDRKEQQDSFGFNIKPNELLAAVCDGMGGHAGGAVASQLAVNNLLSKLSIDISYDNIQNCFLKVLRDTDQLIASMTDKNGNVLGAGTTALIVMLRENNLYWCSVGDSRIYLIRENEMIQATCDHNYKLVLDGKLVSGEITQSEYDKNISAGDALVSFLGVGTLPMTDINNEPFKLLKNDTIILTSDGLYRYLSEKEIKDIVCNFSDLSDTVEVLDAKVKRGSKKMNLERDNMTTIIIKVKNGV